MSSTPSSIKHLDYVQCLQQSLEPSKPNYFLIKFFMIAAVLYDATYFTSYRKYLKRFYLIHNPKYNHTERPITIFSWERLRISFGVGI